MKALYTTLASMLLLLLFIVIGCEKDNLHPTCEIITPENDAIFALGDTITIYVDATDPDGSISDVRFYINDIGVSSTQIFPYIFSWNTDEEELGIYEIKVVVSDKKGLEASDKINISISALPLVVTKEMSSISDTSATCEGNITDDGGSTVTARGICWSTSQNPTLLNDHTTNGSGSGSFFGLITGLTLNTTYYVRAYATNSVGTTYGNEINFHTLSLPTVSTISISNITINSAQCGGNITDDGGSTIIVRGVCWGLSPTPTILSNHTLDGEGNGTYTSSIIGLSTNTTYYVRAYASSSVGTAYGNEINLIIMTPTVSTTSINQITENSALAGGNITNDGGPEVTARGVCWSTFPSPTVVDDYTSDGIGIGSFNSSITGLSPAVTYNIRAYATNSVGTSYGNQLTFKTYQLPTVLSSTPINITYRQATVGGNVTSEGYPVVVERGVFWGTSENPEINGTKLVLGSGTGVFDNILYNLQANTQYYFKAYAINAAGIAYGSIQSFTTLPSTIVDSDGNIYETIWIGNQRWMAENLIVIHYNNGDLIPTTDPPTLDISTAVEPKYQWTYNADENNVKNYGRLYTWYVITDSRGVCPIGWGIPSLSELNTLVNYLGGTNIAGGKLKATSFWESPNTGATNSSGFSARGSGARGSAGPFLWLGTEAGFVTTTQIDASKAWGFGLKHIDSKVYIDQFGKSPGFSVRCIED